MAAGGQSGGGPAGLVANPAARALLLRVSDAARMAFAQRRPLAELFDRNSFSKPESLADAVSRIRKNISYFRINYIMVILGCVAFSLLYHPLSLFTLFVLLAAWIYLYFFRQEPLVLMNRTFSEREVLLLMSIISVVVVFLLSDVGSLLISALTIGAVAVSVHGAFRVPDDLFLDDQEGAGGFLSFLGPSNSAVPILPVVSHV